MEKQKKSFGEVWSTLTNKQSEYLRDYINRQRKKAIIYIIKKITKEIKKEIDEKESEIDEMHKERNYLKEKYGGVSYEFNEGFLSDLFFRDIEIKTLKSILVKIENSIN